MNIEKKQKRLRFCYSFVMISVGVGALIGFVGKLFGMEEDALEKATYGPMIGMVFGIMFLGCFIGMIKYLYDLDPGVQLRGKSIEELEEIIADDKFQIWHHKAIEMLEKKSK